MKGFKTSDVETFSAAASLNISFEFYSEWQTQLILR